MSSKASIRYGTTMTSGGLESPAPDLSVISTETVKKKARIQKREAPH